MVVEHFDRDVKSYHDRVSVERVQIINIRNDQILAMSGKLKVSNLADSLDM